MAPELSSAWQIRPAEVKSWKDPSALENLVLNREVEKPSFVPEGSALIRIRATALNARDLMVLAHDPIYPSPTAPHLVPLADGAGTVAAVGANSTFAIGDRVLIFPFDGAVMTEGVYGGIGEEVPGMEEAGGKGAGDVRGCLGEWGVFRDCDLIRSPEKLSWEENAGLCAAGGTAVNALFFGPKPVEKGMTVLTQGTGGVSCFAIQLAAAIGATVISTSSSDSKLELAKKMGATHTVNYTTHPEWEKEVLRLTGGKGVDHVVEIGGSSTIEQSLTCTKRGGLVSLVGFLSEGKAVDLVPQVLFGGKILRGVFAFTREHDEVLVNMINKYDIKPVVGKLFEYEDAPKAYEAALGHSSVGKIIIKVQ